MADLEKFIGELTLDEAIEASKLLRAKVEALGSTLQAEPLYLDASLSGRTVNILRNLSQYEHVTTAREVAQFGMAALYRQPNCGHKSVNEVRQALAARGILV